MWAGGMWVISVLSSQFCCEPETALKEESLFKNRNQSHLEEQPRCCVVQRSSETQVQPWTRPLRQEDHNPEGKDPEWGGAREPHQTRT